MAAVMSLFWFVPMGFFIGAYGTLIGAGGGFLLVPLLMFLSPQDSASTITAASLSVILANAVSGTAAYAVSRRIGYKTGVLFALATIPGAILGSYLTAFISRRLFGAIFGAILVFAAAFLSTTARAARRAATGQAAARDKARGPKPFRVVDTVVDRQGNARSLSFNIWLGMGLSLLIGCFSSLVGIGGGIIHVPVLTYLFDFPVHIATATSHFILVFTALAGVLTHVFDGTFPTELPRLVLLAIGVIAGAQLGAFISRRVSAPWIVIGLSVALGLVGVRLLIQAF
jgi:uncharacterized membrane protein YfcA